MTIEIPPGFVSPPYSAGERPTHPGRLPTARALTREQLHQLYRDYCTARFPYDYPDWQSDARESHINYDARSYYIRYDEDDNEIVSHVGPLAQLVEAAFRLGAESVVVQHDEEADR